VEWFGKWIVGGGPVFRSFVLVPWDVIHRFEIWQLASYMFLHFGIGAILINMLMLWMFGAPIEDTWGTRRFVRYYFVCGIGAGLCFLVATLALGVPQREFTGASGAIFGLLLAYGMLFPEQTVLVMFIFPMKAKYMVMIYGAIEFLLVLSPLDPVASLSHLSGMLFGYIYIKSNFGARSRRAVRAGAGMGASGGGGFSLDLQRRWKEYKLQRARKKFQVYMKKHGSGRSPWEQ
jgi:membrane associated rhomboid family serine protease